MQERHRTCLPPRLQLALLLVSRVKHLVAGVPHQACAAGQRQTGMMALEPGLGPHGSRSMGGQAGACKAAGAKPNPWLGLTHDEARAVQHCPHPAATAAAALDQLLRVEAGWGDLRAGRHRRSGKRAAWAAAAARRRRRRRGLASAGGCLWCRREWVRSPSLLAGRRRSARRLCWCPEAGDAPGGGCAHCCTLHELSVSDTSEWRKGGRARDASSHASAHAAPSARGGSAALASPTGRAAAAHSAPALAASFS